MKISLRSTIALSVCGIMLAGQMLFGTASAQSQDWSKQTRSGERSGRVLPGVSVEAADKVVVNVADLARQQAERPPDTTPRTVIPPNPVFREEDVLDPADVVPSNSGDITPANSGRQDAPTSPNVASPSPTTTYLGHNDVVKIGTSSIVIPPDTTGAVGLTDVVTFLNNNYIVRNKTTGAQTFGVSEETFWAFAAPFSGPFDPRITYDPFNNRWIVAGVSNAQNANASILIGVSTTSNPAGTFTLFRVDADSTNLQWADFPTLGFNKNWVSVNVNMIVTSSGAFAGGKNLVLDYAQLRAGAFSGTLFSGTGFVASPAVTYSNTENTLYLVTHLSSAGATYAVDTITGTPPTPVYTLGATKTRTGGGWTQPNIGGSIQIIPQAAPLSGASSCGATPCRIETQDAQVRANPIFRNGSIWYAQTIGLPAGVMTRTAAQWTKIDAVTGNFQDGGRVDDPTATQTNGGKWYAYTSIAVNSNNDAIFGFSQFASNQFGAAGYTYRFHSDAPGLMRDPLIYKAGEDYYNKTFGGGRNRYGDYSYSQVDPSNDKDLWTLQEYSQARVGTDDGLTGSNSSRWSTFWAKVNFDPTAAGVTISGRIQTADGRAIGRAIVSITDLSGQVRYVVSNPFGRYELSNISAGETYIIGVQAKGYDFAPQVITPTQIVTTLDFTAL